MSYEISFNNLTFGSALDMIQAYHTTRGMRLPQWKEDVVIRVQMPDKNSKMTHPYLYVMSRYGCVPWKETVVEMFSREWQVVEFVKEKKTEPTKENKSEPVKKEEPKCTNESTKNINVNEINSLEDIIDTIDKLIETMPATSKDNIEKIFDIVGKLGFEKSQTETKNSDNKRVRKNGCVFIF